MSIAEKVADQFYNEITNRIFDERKTKFDAHIELKESFSKFLNDLIKVIPLESGDYCYYTIKVRYINKYNEIDSIIVRFYFLGQSTSIEDEYLATHKKEEIKPLELYQFIVSKLEEYNKSQLEKMAFNLL